MSEKQVKSVQIIFDDDDEYIEKLELEIENLRKVLQNIEKKCLKNNENLRLMCLHNVLKNELNKRLREWENTI